MLETVIFDMSYTKTGTNTNRMEVSAKTSSLDTSPNSNKLSVPATTEPLRNRWFYPSALANDLADVDLPLAVKNETLACAWEYTRSVIPSHSNETRLIAWVRIVVIGIIAEFRGDLVDVAATDKVLGYDVQELIDTLFAGTPGHEAMGREYRAYLLITAEKASVRRSGELFRRYVDALASSPEAWFRMRDADALARFTMAAALACNDFDDVFFTEAEFEILTELCDTLYDAVAFYKHRAEGETNSTFAYFSSDLRRESFHHYREVLWALDAAWAQRRELLCVLNFMRFFGGPIKMTMRRYRFVEEDLTIGRPETDQVIAQTRQHVKLWNRMEAAAARRHEDERYQDIIARRDKLLYEGLAEKMEQSGNENCKHCRYRSSYGAENTGRFGGVELCEECQKKWAGFMRSFPIRAARVFPVLQSHWSVAVELDVRNGCHI